MKRTMILIAGLLIATPAWAQSDGSGTDPVQTVVIQATTPLTTTTASAGDVCGENTCVIVKGEKGDKGEKGEDGTPGSKGVPGQRGQQGEKGDRGEQGIAGKDGAKGDKGDRGARGEQGVAGVGGKDGQDGKNGKDGAKGAKGAKGDKGERGVAGKDANIDIDKVLALNSALSMPVWLEKDEKFAVSGGLGFAGNDTALGMTGVARLNGGVSAFAGGAVTTDGKEWAGKVGMRFGFK